jgi:hypothetical protein
MASLEASLELKVSLKFECANLPRGDLLSKSDPYVEVFLLERNPINGTQQWKSMGRTETLQNNHYPKFMKEIEVPYKFEEEQLLLLRVVDDDFGQKKDDILGECQVKLGTIMGSRGQKLGSVLKCKTIMGGTTRKATITVRAEQSSNINRNIIHLKLQARELDRKDGWFGKSDPFFVIARSKTGLDTDYEDVFKSDFIKQNLNPVWNEYSIPMSKLENGKLRLEVSDYDANKTDLIGYCAITVDDFRQLKKGLQLIHPPTKKKYMKPGYTNSGLVDVVSCRIQERYTMIDYLRGGMQISFILAVDFTGSNGDPNLPGTLHYGSGVRSNPYTEAIQGVGSILLEYDYDKLIQAFGFGARPVPNAPVSHCFALNGRDTNPECYGISGVLDAYRSVFQRGCVLSGPTNFAPIIRAATSLADFPTGSAALQYSVLLLLTDGAISDLADTIDAICEAAKTSLSIIIVGVGNADFSSMQVLDADVNPLVSSRGEKCYRDVVQFVPFQAVRNNAQLLAKETLAELPDQISQFFGQKGIPPGRPIIVSDDSVMFGGEGEITVQPASSRSNYAPSAPGATVVAPPSGFVPTSSHVRAPPPPPTIRQTSQDGKDLFNRAYAAF